MEDQTVEWRWGRDGVTASPSTIGDYEGYCNNSYRPPPPPPCTNSLNVRRQRKDPVHHTVSSVVHRHSSSVITAVKASPVPQLCPPRYVLKILHTVLLCIHRRPPATPAHHGAFGSQRLRVARLRTAQIVVVVAAATRVTSCQGSARLSGCASDPTQKR